MPARKEAVEGMIRMFDSWADELATAKHPDVAKLAVDLRATAVRLEAVVAGWPNAIGNVVGRDSEPVRKGAKL